MFKGYKQSVGFGKHWFQEKCMINGVAFQEKCNCSILQ